MPAVPSIFSLNWTGHFMNPNLLHNQFETLEPPTEAIRIKVSAAPEAIVTEIRQRMGL